MTVQQMVDFLSNYGCECEVTMLQCAGDNPMDEDMGIADVIAVARCNGDEKIVIIPE